MPFILLVAFACREEAPWARASRIERLDEAIGGPKATARVDDFLLENDRVRLAILGARRSFGPARLGREPDRCGSPAERCEERHGLGLRPARRGLPDREPGHRHRRRARRQRRDRGGRERRRRGDRRRGEERGVPPAARWSLVARAGAGLRPPHRVPAVAGVLGTAESARLRSSEAQATSRIRSRQRAAPIRCRCSRAP